MSAKSVSTKLKKDAGIPMQTARANTKVRQALHSARDKDVGMDDCTRKNGCRSDFFSVGGSNHHPDDPSVMER